MGVHPSRFFADQGGYGGCAGAVQRVIRTREFVTGAIEFLWRVPISTYNFA
jgi:hypothetical protein